MRVLWICGLPRVVQEKALNGEDHGAHAAWSWILGHFPPPADIELHIGCFWPGGDRTKSFQFEEVTFHLVPCLKKGRALLLFQRDAHYFKELFAQIRPDIVHGWGTEDSFGLVARRLAPRRHVIGIQGLIHACYRHRPKTYRVPLMYLNESLTLRKARYIAAESQYALDCASSLATTAVKRLIEHPLRREFLAAAPSTGLAKTVLFVGNIQEGKGILDAIAAFSEAAVDEWRLHVIGRGPVPDEDRMARLVRDRGIGNRFRHSPVINVADLVQAMQESSVFILPTRVDTGPTSLKEALTLGLWPVCYDNSGPREYIHKYGFGSLAKDQDVNNLGVVLKRCLNEMPWNDESKRTALARQTREDFSRERAWEKLTAYYTSIVTSVVSR